MARRIEHFIVFTINQITGEWRVATVRNIGAIEGNKPAPDNDWETVKKGGDTAIKQWIADQMKGRSCTVVLVKGIAQSLRMVVFKIVNNSEEASQGFWVTVWQMGVFETISTQGRNALVGGQHPYRP